MGCAGSSAATSTKPELIRIEYFPLLGRAESLRMLIHSCDIKYEDVPITMEEWPTMKGKGAYEKSALPQIIIGSKRYAETVDMLNMIAKTCGMYAKVDAEGGKFNDEMTVKMNDDPMSGFGAWWFGHASKEGS